MDMDDSLDRGWRRKTPPVELAGLKPIGKWAPIYYT